MIYNWLKNCFEIIIGYTFEKSEININDMVHYKNESEIWYVLAVIRNKNPKEAIIRRQDQGMTYFNKTVFLNDLTKI